MRIWLSALVVVAAGCGGGAKVINSAPVPAAPASFVHSTAEAQATRVIEVREGLTHAQAMRAVTDALGQRFTVDVTDPRSGFAMTAWQATLVRDGVPDPRYRTRITARFQGDDWKRLQLRNEANWARGEEWDVGYDTAQLDTVAADLRVKIGKKM